jgi:quercetin dioxygenase-like cupin family protein
MSAQLVMVTPDDRPRGLNVVGEQITVLADGAATGSYEIFRQAGPEGSGPPPHSHPWDEAFYVIAGQVIFGVDGDDNRLAPPGALVHIPGGSTHWFRFGPGGGEMSSMTSRAGAELILKTPRGRAGLPRGHAAGRTPPCRRSPGTGRRP